MKKKILVAAVALVVVSVLTSPASAQSRFGFKLGGGMAYIGGGDLNPGLKGYMDYITDMFEDVIGADVDGAYEPFHFGLSFDAEIFYQVTPKIAIGLGVGYFSMSQASSLTLSMGPETLTIFRTPTVAAIPVTLNFHYFVPLGERLKFVLTAGAGWYFARYDLEEMQSADTELVETSGGGFGAHGGLGLELELTRSFFLTLDVLGRYARVGELTGARVDDPGSEGTIWSFDADMGSVGLGRYPLVIWEEGVPSGIGIEIENLRKARLGLSGFSAAFGILIRL